MSEDINTQPSESNEIDLLELFKRLWKKRKFIIYFTAVCFFLGILVALFSPKQYKADCVIVPQVTSKSAIGGSVSSLAALAGINLGDMMATETLSPMVYPDILNNVDFQKELISSTVHFSKWDEPISLLDYFTDEKYTNTSFLGHIKKYTIQLPRLIMEALRGKPKESEIPSNLKSLTFNEAKCVKALSKINTLLYDQKKGYLTLTTVMPEPIAAAEINRTTYYLLQKYITRFKLEKVQSNLDFLKDRHDEAQITFQERQLAYAQFQDANRSLSSNIAKIKEEQLKSEYEIANAIYTELTTQMLQAELRVKEDTPILTAVKPTMVPSKKFKPKRAQIVVVWTILGFVLGCGAVLGLDYLKKQGCKYPRKWSIED